MQFTFDVGPQRDGVLRVVKGHGTHNDFVLIDDRNDEVDLTPGLVRALADRHGGVGADGVIRLVASALIPAGKDLLKTTPEAAWFMDYRNADGSIAEMCGNGVRVLAAMCDRLGLWSAQTDLIVGTRAGARPVRRILGPEGQTWYEVEMGEARLAGSGSPKVSVPGLDPGTPGWGVDVGNPHLVVPVPDPRILANLDLFRVPEVSPAPPDGVNVEFVVPSGVEMGSDGPVGRLAMRVHERGVGETLSCGTGVCAAARAAYSWSGPDGPSRWMVEVPGGTLRVDLSDEGVRLAGPAVLVAQVDVELNELGVL